MFKKAQVSDKIKGQSVFSDGNAIPQEAAFQALG